MKPYIHAKISAKRHGGVPEDYVEIHDFIDSPKATLADVRQRAILHNSFGCYIVEKIFGHTITNSEGKLISTRDIAEEHINDDMGWIPTPKDWLKNLEIEDWMLGPVAKKRRFIPLRKVD